MGYPTLYPAQVNSPATVLVEAIDDTTTTIVVAAGAVLPEAPNLLTIGIEEDAEAVLMTAKDGDTLTVTRGVEGVARAWDAGEGIARYPTAKDQNDVIEHLEALRSDLDAGLAELEGDMSAALSSHEKSTSNPHGVTAEQVGLGNVDNTPDVNKPLSTSARMAIDGAMNLVKRSLTDHTKMTAAHGATAAAEASTIVARDMDGRIKAADPAASDDVETMGHVAGELAKKADAAHAHAASDVSLAAIDGLPDAENVQDAVQALFMYADSGKAAIAGAIGEPAATDDAFAQLAAGIDAAKATAAAHLTDKGVEAAGDEPLAALAGKIAEISVGGVPWYFGDGSLGDLVITSNRTETVAEDTGLAVMQVKSLRVGAGATLTTSHRCKGLVILSQGDVVVDGTISMDKKSPKIDFGCVGPTLFPAVPIVGDGYAAGAAVGVLLQNILFHGGAIPVGGNGGNGGGAQYGEGGKGRPEGGGYGGGGTGGINYNPNPNVLPGRGGTGNVPVGAAMAGGLGRSGASLYAGGGGCAGDGARSGGLYAAGGAGPGGGGGGGYSNNFSIDRPGANGDAGDAYGGGRLTIIANGNILISSSGVLTASGGNGGKGGDSGYEGGDYIGAVAGAGGGGGGGGIVALYHVGALDNKGNISVAGGQPGIGGMSKGLSRREASGGAGLPGTKVTVKIEP